jgi:hypothetical protein
MDAVEKGHTSLRKASMYWNIPFTSLSNHINGRTKSRKVGLQGMLIEVEDGAIVSWVLNMQKTSLFVTIHELKLKVAEFRSYSNQIHALSKWCSRRELIILLKKNTIQKLIYVLQKD